MALILVAAIAGYLIAKNLAHNNRQSPDGLQNAIKAVKILENRSKERPNAFGDYLASGFAQNHQQWDDAANFIERLKHTPMETDAILKKRIILAMGADDPESAIAAAKKYLTNEDIDNPSRTLATLFVIAGALKDQDYEQANQLVETLPYDGLTSFITPLVKGWLKAADGKSTPTLRKGALLHNMHAAFIEDYLGNTKALVRQLDIMNSYEELSSYMLEQLGDMYALAGKTDKAKELYQEQLLRTPAQTRLAEKLESEEINPALMIYHPVKTPQEGMSRAFYDIALMLYEDRADESARIFSKIALYINPNLEEANILLAAIAMQNKSLHSAITYFNYIKQTSPYYLEVQLQLADLHDEMGNKKQAINTLQKLYDTRDSITALIKMGDLYRYNEDYKKALEIYNKAANDYYKNDFNTANWPILYKRGITYERLNNWTNAKKDLEQALKLEPEQPQILNYLGYAMADRNENLSDALAMIEKAVSLQPNDGYIIDSLGWVYYKLERYQDAAAQLEQAIELEPSAPVINDHLGDAYWKVGRKIEARYQWQRALKSKEIAPDLQASISTKLKEGLPASASFKEANASDLSSNN